MDGESALYMFLDFQV